MESSGNAPRPREAAPESRPSRGKPPRRSPPVFTILFLALYGPALAWGWRGSLGREVSFGTGAGEDDRMSGVGGDLCGAPSPEGRGGKQKFGPFGTWAMLEGTKPPGRARPQALPAPAATQAHWHKPPGRPRATQAAWVVQEGAREGAGFWAMCS